MNDRAKSLLIVDDDMVYRQRLAMAMEKRGWAVRQAHIAVGSGTLFGSTDDPMRLLRAQYLPERETDLALASLVGQWGFVAGAGAVLAGLILVWRLALAARTSRTPHGALVGGGLAILMGVAPNIFLNPMRPSIDRIVERVHSRERPQVAGVVTPGISRTEAGR